MTEEEQLALAPPRAHGPPLARALLKATPGDFELEEMLPFAPDGGPAHCLLLVAKDGLDTLAVARRIARLAGIAPMDVGFAGLKDRRARVRQWFSVPAASAREASGWREGEEGGGGFRVLEVHAHGRKLKRGAVASNRFRIRLRGLTPPPVPAAFSARLEGVRRRGVPNYFGPQRFGRDLANLTRVREFAATGALPVGREARAFVYSAARALLFNAVLAERVVAGSWDTLLPGERVNLDGSRSHFAAPVIDATLLARCAALDVHPTGPLAGSGPGPEADALALETAVFARFAPLPAALAGAGLESARRSLRLVPQELDGCIAGENAQLVFCLPAGAYATTLLAELFELHEAALALPADGE